MINDIIKFVPFINVVYATVFSNLVIRKVTKRNYSKREKIYLSEEEKRILFVIKENPVITQKKIQEETNISLGTVKRILPKLQEKGILARRGSRRSGKWEILG